MNNLKLTREMKKKMSSSFSLESMRVGSEERMVWNQRNKKRERSRMGCIEGWPRVLFIASKAGDPRSCDQNTSQLRGLGEKWCVVRVASQLRDVSFAAARVTRLLLFTCGLGHFSTLCFVYSFGALAPTPGCWNSDGWHGSSSKLHHDYLHYHLFTWWCLIHLNKW
jgi:hypothetical protein